MADDLTRDATPTTAAAVASFNYFVHRLHVAHDKIRRTNERTSTASRCQNLRITSNCCCQLLCVLSTLEHRIDIISEWFNDSQGYYTIHHWVCVWRVYVV